ncbi:hypothetical protein C8Q79DRAFT_1020612, partial [Trametes meyenii]
NVDPDDHKNIKAARLRVHLNIDPYYLPLPVSVRERRIFPSNAAHRLREDGNFEFHVYRSQSYPHPLIGIQGDIWINITQHRGGVWFRGSSGSWEPWIHGCEHDSAHLGVEGVGTAHPWIRGYCLQFTGLDIWWYQHEALPIHQARWDRVWSNRLPYATLPHLHPALVRHNATRKSLSHHRVFPEGPLGRRGRKKLKQATNDPPQGASILVDKTNIAPLSTDEPMDVIPSKRPPPPLAALGEAERVAKRQKVVVEAQESVGSSLSSTTATSILGPEAQASTSEIRAGYDIHIFLGSLPLPLNHHAPIFLALGITSRVHLEALAHARDEAKEQFLRELSARDMSSMELMVLCEALKAIQNLTPAPLLSAPNPAATPSIGAFLAQMRPCMSRHLATFEHFGVDIEHLPVLAGMNLDTYELFEGHLADCGVTWVERLLFKAAISVGR